MSDLSSNAGDQSDAEHNLDVNVQVNVAPEPFGAPPSDTHVSRLDKCPSDHIDLSITVAPLGNVKKGDIPDIPRSLLQSCANHFRELLCCQLCTLAMSLERGER
jgi:hypothetical protein